MQNIWEKLTGVIIEDGGREVHRKEEKVRNEKNVGRMYVKRRR